MRSFHQLSNKQNDNNRKSSETLEYDLIHDGDTH